MPTSITITATCRHSGSTLATSAVFDERLIDKKIGFMTEELSKMAGTSCALTEKNVDFSVDDNHQNAAA
jgi:hypothetical protein